MKKVFTLTIMLVTLAMNAQDYGHVSNPVVDVVIFEGLDALGPDNAITVPDGYFLTFSKDYGTWYAFREGGPIEFSIAPSSTALPSGYKFYTFLENAFLIAYVHEYASTGSTFSYTEAELDNSVKLFPNPTTSEVALNSEKTYEIQVFDILGNKVM